MVDLSTYNNLFSCQTKLNDILFERFVKISLLLWNTSIVGYDMTSSDRDDKNTKGLTYHRIIESFKFSYARRGQLGDPEFDSRINEVGDMLQLVQKRHFHYFFA